MAGQSGRVWLGVVALCLVQFVDVLGVTVVVTALPAMLADLNASPEAGGLIATGYAMCFGGLLLFGARLGDRFGHRRIILVGLVIFALAAVLGATAETVAVLTAARCLQGAAAAISVPAALRLLTTITSSGGQRRTAIAMWSAAGAAAGASGFVIGGLVTNFASWRLVFWGYVPLAALLAVAILFSVLADRDVNRARSLNLIGSALFTGSVMLVVVAMTLLPKAQRARLAVGLLAVAVATFTAFIVVDRRARAPLLPPALLRQHPMREGAVGSLLNTLTTSSSITLATLYVQDARGRDPLTAGLMLLPFSVSVIAGSALAARVLARWDPQRVIASGLATIAIFAVLLVPAASSGWALPVCAAVGGAGLGLSSVAATSLGTTVPRDERATASGIINTAAQLGTALGIAGLLLVAALTTGAPTHGVSRPSSAWLFAAGTAFAGAAMFLTWSKRDSSQRPIRRGARCQVPVEVDRPGYDSRVPRSSGLPCHRGSVPTRHDAGPDFARLAAGRRPGVALAG